MKRLANNELPDPTDFTYQECIFGGDECVWFFPHMEGVKWTQQNLIFRSSIWRKSDWTLVSPGFKKFFNWEEQPTIDPAPDVLNDKIDVIEKLDGSCLIVSKYKGELIVRTRRGIAEEMPNGHEIALFKKSYPLAFNNDDINSESFTYIYEWITPTNKIVLNYNEPEIRLIGVISHADYRYLTQQQLDEIAAKIHVKRPLRYSYNSLAEMLETVEALKNEEGRCAYYGGGQKIRKIKSSWYKSVHNFRNGMTLKNMVDLYFDEGMPSYEVMTEKVLNQYSWEGLNMAQPLISMICDAMKEVNQIIAGMQKFIDTQLISLSSRKQKAEKIIGAYGTTNRADMVFSLLDKKPLNRNQWKKLLFQTLV